MLGGTLHQSAGTRLLPLFLMLIPAVEGCTKEEKPGAKKKKQDAAKITPKLSEPAARSSMSKK